MLSRDWNAREQNTVDPSDSRRITEEATTHPQYIPNSPPELMSESPGILLVEFW